MFAHRRMFIGRIVQSLRVFNGVRVTATYRHKTPSFYRAISSESIVVDRMGDNEKKNNLIVRQPLNAFEFLLKYGLSLALFPMICFGFISVQANMEVVLLSYGKYQEKLCKGLHFRTPFGRVTQMIFTGLVSESLPKSKIVDRNGNPIVISGTVNYHIEAPERFVLNVAASQIYIRNQAEIILKRVASEYPYEAKDDRCLVREGGEISARLTDELQKLVEPAGVRVGRFFITDLGYAPEIAQQMLIRQRAKAYVDAKDTITLASVDIVNKMLQDVETKCAIRLSHEMKERLIGNLLLVLTSETGVQPVITLNSQDLQNGSNDSSSSSNASTNSSTIEMKSDLSKKFEKMMS